ncbi:chemotaxis protein CheA [Cytophagaceae bacterium DM2B3-1]|uniref:Chemotaxis protein CheA n=1 Tax=Xanthocytophaga flava TaxID=3048013 RepID=A0ABT7CTJ2_9BACT|nr:chemotaxis protein CheA [Xanthocytophaga flavus]MDJ1467942.1 chemotaxis protein CheA [Xanthocytophaga flavus]MDJ1497069.1 chemotaxis protein CheA [Xanthocytophaga flavus]
MKGDDELKEIFLAEALENTEQLNKLFTDLEKDNSNKKAIDAIFRITHTLKANAAGMGFSDLATMAHTMEDVFNVIKSGNMVINADIFNDLFKANDVLCALIEQVKTPEKVVKFKGIKTKLEVLIRNSKEKPEEKISEEPVNIAIQPDKAGIVQAEVGSVITQLPVEDEVKEVEKTEHEETAIAFSDNIHVPIRKLDNLLDLIGELIIEKDRVIAMNGNTGRSRQNDYARLQRITSELQYSIMDVRLVQVNVLFNKFHRIVRDVAALENKKVDLSLEGTEIEIDRTILQIISDSLVHLVRNAVSHGIESTQGRLASGKSEAGKLKLAASSEREEIIITITDDGKGIHAETIAKKAIEKGIITREMALLMSEEEKIQLIFEPGFSSAETVTAVSGRGVGMDVVRKAIDSIGGVIGIDSVVGIGTTFTLRMPSSMAVKGALLFELRTGDFAVPLSYTKAVVAIQKKAIRSIGNNLFTTYLGKTISLVYLNDLFQLKDREELTKGGVMLESYHKTNDDEKIQVIIITFNNKEIGFVVDKLLQQKEIVEKPLKKPLENVKFISGATILGNGNVCLVVDVPSIIQSLFRNSKITSVKTQQVAV